MKDLFFFDVNARVGNTVCGPRPGAAELLAEMDRNGVDRALVRHNETDGWGPVISNQDLADLLRSDESGRLVGVWSILPDQCGELPAGAEFFAQMKKNRIKALTLSPAAHHYVPCRLTLGRLLDEATERRVPVLLHSCGAWREIYDFLKEFPNLHAIINLGFRWGSDRYCRPLLENYPNCRADIAGYWVPEGIRELAKTYGADRLLYGSGFPNCNHGSAMLQIRHSGLDDDATRAVAGGNLAKMLEEVQL